MVETDNRKLIITFIDRSLKERKEILQQNMTEIPFRIVFSEMKHIDVSIVHWSICF